MVEIDEVEAWWRTKQSAMIETLYGDPTAKWGNAPTTTSREVGWFVARRAETSAIRKANQQKWRVPKKASLPARHIPVVRGPGFHSLTWDLNPCAWQSCDETLYANEYFNFAGKSPFSNKPRDAATGAK